MSKAIHKGCPQPRGRGGGGLVKKRTQGGGWVSGKKQKSSNSNFNQNFFHLCFFVAKPQKTSIDGLKCRDLVMGREWLVNFNVSAVRCPVSQRVSYGPT